MFKGMSPEVREEYKKYIKANMPCFVSVWLLILILTVAVTFEFWTGIKLMTAVGAFAFEDTEKVEGIKQYVIAFACLLVSEKLLAWIFNKLRRLLLKRAEAYMLARFENGAETESKEKAFYCRYAFGEAMDEIFVLANNASLSLALAAFTAYVNLYAGIPLVIAVYTSMWRKVRGKEESHFLQTTVMLLLQVYFISLIFLIMFRTVPYGGLMGYYSSIMFRMTADKDLPAGWRTFLMESKRTEALGEYFGETSPHRKRELSSYSGNTV